MYDLPVQIAAEAKVRPEEVLERQEIKRLDPSAQFALISAREAWADAGAPEIDPVRLGVDYATGIGGLWTLLDAWDTLREKGSAPRSADDGADAHAERGIRRDQHVARRTRLRPHRRVGLRLEHRVDRQRLRAPAAGPRRRDPRRRRRVLRAPDHPGVVLVDAGAVEAQRRPGHRIPALRRRPRRIRHGRGRRDDRHGDRRAREGARRQDLRRDRRHRRHERLVPHHRSRPRGSRRRARRLRRARAGRRDRRRRHPHQRARHQHPGRRHRRVQGAAGRVRRPRARASRCRPRRPHTATCWAARVRSRRSSRSWRFRTRVAPPTINIANLDPEIPLSVSGTAQKLGDEPQLAISNSFGFGGHNAVVAIRSV